MGIEKNGSRPIPSLVSSRPFPGIPELLAEIGQKLRAISQSGRFIFRSSTNAEDLAGFNGT